MLLVCRSQGKYISWDLVIKHTVNFPVLSLPSPSGSALAVASGKYAQEFAWLTLEAIANPLQKWGFPEADLYLLSLLNFSSAPAILRVQCGGFCQSIPNTASSCLTVTFCLSRVNIASEVPLSPLTSGSWDHLPGLSEQLFNS